MRFFSDMLLIRPAGGILVTLLLCLVLVRPQQGSAQTLTIASQTGRSVTVNVDCHGSCTGLQIEWGDGSSLVNVMRTGPYSHTFAADGRYCIRTWCSGEPCEPCSLGRCDSGSCKEVNIASAADTVKPQVRITGPTSAPSYFSPYPDVDLAGTASDNVGVARVTWRSSSGDSGTASGTTSWSIRGVRLNSGANVISVTAVDTSGNRATDTITVSYQEEEDSGGGGGGGGGGTASQVVSFTVDVMPAELSLSLQQSGMIPLSYQARSSGMTGFTVTSDHGEVVDDRDRVIYRVPVPLSIPLVRGTGIRPESLLLPPTVVATILQNPKQQYFYQRRFTHNAIESITRVSLRFTPSFTIQPVPSMFSVAPNQRVPLVLSYQASAPGPYTFTVRSERGEVVSGDGRVLFRDNRPLSLPLVQGTGRAVENIVLGPGVISKALQAGSNPVYYRRTFTYGGVRETTKTTLMILPASMGGFMLTRMELSFVLNDQVTGTPGRVTVPLDYKKLRARAVLSYNGSGLLRAQWKVDGQVIGFVTRQLVAGIEDVVLESPEVPGFPTYATGSHKVELEVLEPRPLFDEPLAYYFVSLKKKARSIRLLAPAAGSVVALDRDILFRWQMPPRVDHDTVQMTILQPLPPDGFDSRSSTADVEGSRFLSVLLPRGADRYQLPVSYRNRLRIGTGYHWQVMAMKGEMVTAFSEQRAITFAGGEEGGRVLFERLALGKEEDGEGRVAADLKNATRESRHNVRVEFLLDDEVVDVSFLPLLAAGATVPVEGGYPVEDSRAHRIVVRAVEAGEVLATAETGTRAQAAKAPPPPGATCGDGEVAIGEFCLVVEGGIPESGDLSGDGTIHVDFMKSDIPVAFSGLGLDGDRIRVTSGSITVQAGTSDALPWQDLVQGTDATVEITRIEFMPDHAAARVSLAIAPPYMTTEILMGPDQVEFHPDGVSGELALTRPLEEQALSFPLDTFRLGLASDSHLTLDRTEVSSSSFTGSLKLPADVLDADARLDFTGLELQADGGLYGTASLGKTTIAATNIGLSGRMTIDLTTERSPADPPGRTWMGAWLDSGTISLDSLLGGVDVGDVSGLYIDSGLQGTVDKDLDITARVFGSGELQFTVSLTHFSLSGNNHSSRNNAIAGSISLSAAVPLAGDIFSTDLDITADGIGDTITLGSDKKVDVENLAQVSFMRDSRLVLAGDTVKVFLHAQFTSLGRLAGSFDGTIDTVVYIDSTGKVGLAQLAGQDLVIQKWISLGDSLKLEFADLFSLGLEKFGLRFDDRGFSVGIGGKLQISDKFASADATAGIYLNSGDLWCDEISVDLDMESVSFEGTVAFRDDRDKEEFHGDMNLSIVDTLNVASELIVGRKKSPDDFYYFYIDGHLDMPPPGIQLTPYPIAFYGFGGGMYYNMCLSLDENGERTYSPAKGAFGLKASTTLGTSFDKGYTFHARPEMELRVQTQGGESRCASEGAGFGLSLHGPIYLLCDLTDEKDYRKFETMTEFGCSDAGGCAFSSRISVNDFAVLEPGDKQLLGIDADMDMKLGEDEWYFRMGTKDAPSTVKVLPNYAEDLLEANGYLDVDDTGIRAGALVQLDSGEQTLLIFYGRVWGGLSSDFAVSFDPGFVYAEFAVWMGVEAGIDLGEKIEIFSAQAGLDGGVRTPDPTRLWVHGRLEYSVLDGLASGKWEMTFVWGDPLPEQGMTVNTWPVFDSMEPEDGSMEVPVGAVIRVHLTTPVSSAAWGERPMNGNLGAGRCGSQIQRFPDAEGNTYELAALLDDFWLEEGRGGRPGRIPGTMEWDGSCLSFTFIPDNLLAPNQWYTVHFNARARGSIIQGFDSTEEKTFLIHTAGPPSDLKMMVRSSYPEDGQKYCFLDYPVEVEFNRGLEFLRSGNVKGRLEKADGSEVAGSYHLSADNRTLRFTPASPLEPDTLYTFRLVRTGGTGTAGGMTQAGTTGGVLDLNAGRMQRAPEVRGTGGEPASGQRANMTATAHNAGPDMTVVGDDIGVAGDMPHALPTDILDGLGGEWLRIRFRTGRFHTLQELLSDEGTRLWSMPPEVCSSGELAAMQSDPSFDLRLVTAQPVNWRQVDLEVRSSLPRAESALCRMEFGPRSASTSPPSGGTTYSYHTEQDLAPDEGGGSTPGSGGGSGNGGGSGHGQGTSPGSSADTETCSSRQAERNVSLTAHPTLIQAMVGKTGSDDNRYGFRLDLHPDDYRVERLAGDCEGVNRLWDHDLETGERSVSPTCLRSLVTQLADRVRLDIHSRIRENDGRTVTLDLPDIPDDWGSCGNVSGGELPTYSPAGDTQDAEIFVHADSGGYQSPENAMDTLGPGMFQGVEADVLPGLDLAAGDLGRFAAAAEDFERLRREYASLGQDAGLSARYDALGKQYTDLLEQFSGLGSSAGARAVEDFSDLVDSFTDLNTSFQNLNNGDDLF